jgi:hypothetical protein
MDIHKELYQLLQCLHHAENINQNQIPKAFTRKQNELKQFIKPAQVSDSFKQHYQIIINTFITDSIKALNHHYEARISELLGYLRSQRIPNNTVRKGANVAMRWAKKNFGKKLTTKTTEKFQQIVSSIPPLSPTLGNSKTSPPAASQTQSPLTPDDCPTLESRFTPVDIAGHDIPSTPGASKTTPPVASTNQRLPNPDEWPTLDSLKTSDWFTPMDFTGPDIPFTPGTSKTTPPVASTNQRLLNPDEWPTLDSLKTSDWFTPVDTTLSPRNPYNPDPDKSPPIPQPKRRRIKSPRNTQTTATGPQITLHRERSRWKIPPINSRTVVLGDSNLSRVTNSETKVRSIEFHSFPGANIKHFENLLSPTPYRQNTPKTVILSVGINNRTYQPSTLRQQFANMIHNASKTFPNASIHVPLINIPPEIPTHQQTNLGHLNQLIQTLSEHQHTFQVIPKLPQENFKIDLRDSYKIHWTTETANALISHWASYLTERK